MQINFKKIAIVVLVASLIFGLTCGYEYSLSKKEYPLIDVYRDTANRLYQLNETDLAIQEKLKVLNNGIIENLMAQTKYGKLFSDFRQKTTNDLTKIILFSQIMVNSIIELHNRTILPDWAKIRKSVVAIQVGRCGGAGTIIREDDKYLYVLSVEHLLGLSGEINVQVTTTNGENIIVKDISPKNVYISDKVDLALIKVPKPEGEFEVVHLAKLTNIPRIGDRIYTMGHPYSYLYSVSEGIVSNYIKQVYKDKPYITMMTTAPVYPGNSGGSIIDKYTEVVGVVSAIKYIEYPGMFNLEREFLHSLCYTVNLADIYKFLEENDLLTEEE